MNAVLFDLDGTLHDRNATIQRWLERHIQEFDLPAAYAARFVALDDFGYRSKSKVFPQLIGEFNLKHGPDELMRHYSTALDDAQAMPHAHAVLRELRQMGWRTSIVTNGWQDAQTRCIERCGLTELVDDIVISQAVGLSKPDPRIYELALQRLGVPVSGAWFVGDSPRNDIWGPQQIGLRAAYLPSGHALAGETPQVVLRDLRDVLQIVRLA